MKKWLYFFKYKIYFGSKFFTWNCTRSFCTEYQSDTTSFGIFALQTRDSSWHQIGQYSSRSGWCGQANRFRVLCPAELGSGCETEYHGWHTLLDGTGSGQSKTVREQGGYLVFGDHDIGDDRRRTAVSQWKPTQGELRIFPSVVIEWNHCPVCCMACLFGTVDLKPFYLILLFDLPKLRAWFGKRNWDGEVNETWRFGSDIWLWRSVADQQLGPDTDKPRKFGSHWKFITTE